ncbi:MAG: alpha-glucosidase, partial [Parvularculaceae bacterium]
MTPRPAPVAERAAPWWRGATIYQVYPRSFKDTNGDGVGDLKGCIAGIDHIASLGVDAVWLSPFFTSPMHDFGYDVADYRGVDPLFGNLADFDEFVTRAHASSLKVIIDQVYSHTSDQHAWFAESRQSRDNPKADWFVWADAKPDGSPPNNWQSVFGGGAWEWDARRRQYYFHNFLAQQPDLNLHNPAVQDAILDVARFWLARGVDGFRLDALNFAMHDPQLRDNPPRKVFRRPPTRPFDFQDHKFSMSHPGIPKFLERLRAAIDEFPDRFTVAEVGGERAFDEMKMFTAGDHRLNTAYSFDFLYAPTLTKELVIETARRWPEGGEWPSWAFSNHDAPRAISRWAGACPPDDYSKLLALLLGSLRGNIFLYQGEELGLQQGEVPFEKLKDPEAITNWPATLGRDGARTPLPWTENALNAGFSAAEPWLPIDASHVSRAVDRQNRDQQSVLNFTRRVIAFRKASAALRLGAIEFLPSPDDVVAFVRSFGPDTTLCVFNIGEKAAAFTPPDAGDWSIRIETTAQ